MTTAARAIQDRRKVLWIQTVISAIHGQAGAMADDVARRAMSIADDVVDGFAQRERGETDSGLVMARAQVPQDMKAGGR